MPSCESGLHFLGQASGCTLSGDPIRAAAIICLTPSVAKTLPSSFPEVPAAEVSVQCCVKYDVFIWLEGEKLAMCSYVSSCPLSFMVVNRKRDVAMSW